MDVIEYEVLDEADTSNIPAMSKRSAKEIIDSNLNDIQDLYSLLSDTNLTIPQKLDELLKVKTSMISPMIQLVDNPNADKRVAASASAVISLVDSIEASLYKKASFELSQDIDFTHPKVQLAFKFIFEAVIDNLSEFLNKEEIDIFSNQMAIALTGFENEMNVRLRGISANILNTIDNPLIKK